jgi:hypothetical protein
VLVAARLARARGTARGPPRLCAPGIAPGAFEQRPVEVRFPTAASKLSGPRSSGRDPDHAKAAAKSFACRGILIHYPSDINIGREHGMRIGGYTIRFARQDGAA